MGKIFRTEKLSLNADNIRIRSEDVGEFEITDSKNNVLISRATIESDISSLALQNSQSSLQNVEQNSDISSLANTITTNDSDLSSLAATDVTHSSDISSLATSLGGGTAQLDSDISSLASSSSLEAKQVDADVSSLAALITTNDVYAQTVSLEDAFNNEQAFVTIDYSQAGFATPPSVVGTMISFKADDPIMGVQLSGQPTTTSATFVFSDELPSTGYKLEVLSAV